MGATPMMKALVDCRFYPWAEEPARRLHARLAQVHGSFADANSTKALALEVGLPLEEAPASHSVSKLWRWVLERAAEDGRGRALLERLLADQHRRATHEEIRTLYTAEVVEPASRVVVVAEDRLELEPPPAPPALSRRSPFPLLNPVEHPDQLGGRDEELEELTDLLSGSRRLLAMYAPSGYGKSSLLIAGLLPRLRAAGVPVAMHRHPTDPTLAQTLLDLLVQQPVPPVDATAFDDWVRRIRDQFGAPPIFVLDQFEEVFKGERFGARRRLGELLARTAQIGAVGDPSCRWVLAYREEFHGQVVRWLGDVFVGEDPPGGLPRDLLPPRGWEWPLAPLGSRAPEAAFLDAVSRPLSAYPDAPWSFPEGHAERLAAGFAEARRAQRAAPLTPKLQVVLNELVAEADEGELAVPEDVAVLVDGALRRHLLAVLGKAFRAAPDPVTERTLAAIALQRLVDDDGRARAEGLPTADLAACVGEATLHRLAEWDARLVVAVSGDDGATRWRLSHDRLAAILTGLEDAELFGEGVGVDPGLVQLNRRVGQRAAQYAETGDEATLSLPRGDGRRIARHRDRLLWGEARRAWWRASRDAARRARVRWWAIGVTLAAVVVGTTLGVVYARHQAQVRQALAQFAEASPDAGESVLGWVSELMRLGAPDAEIDRLILAKKPWSAALAAPEREVEPARERIIRVLLGDLEATEEVEEVADKYGRLVAGFQSGQHPQAPGRGWWAEGSPPRGEALRGDLHRALRARFGAPPTAVDWVAVPGGAFPMGSEDRDDEGPVHEVDVSGFQALRHEVTRAQWAAFDAESMERADGSQSALAAVVERWGPEGGARPMWAMTWFEAVAFAAWLDPRGRLPTEAEWEYAARGGPKATSTRYWNGDAVADLATVGWFDQNSRGALHAVCEKQDAAGAPSHPLRLCDVHGNLFEWTMDWHADDAYGDGSARRDPRGPRRGVSRVQRGGAFLLDASLARAASRFGAAPGPRSPTAGLRVVRPAP